MRNTITSLLFLFVGISVYAQVGINTKDPHATLDVNGTMRLQTRSIENTNAKKLLGVDENGMIIELEMDENLYIEDNKVKYNSRKESVHSITMVNIGPVHNLAGIIWPGGAGNGKGTIRMQNVLGDMEVTGIDISTFDTPMDAHGYTITLYNTNGELRLKSEDSGSNANNQFILSDGNDVNLKRFEMVKLMYDGIEQKWLVMSKH